MTRRLHVGLMIAVALLAAAASPRTAQAQIGFNPGYYAPYGAGALSTFNYGGYGPWGAWPGIVPLYQGGPGAVYGGSLYGSAGAALFYRSRNFARRRALLRQRRLRRRAYRRGYR